eukprot:6647592-Prymnesium_polylepis.2
MRAIDTKLCSHALSTRTARASSKVQARSVVHRVGLGMQRRTPVVSYTDATWRRGVCASEPAAATADSRAAAGTEHA